VRNSLLGGPTAKGMIEHRNLLKLMVATEMIGMSVRVDDDHWLVRYFCYGLAQIANATTSVDQHRFVPSLNQIADGCFIVARFMENQKAGSNFVDLKPIVANRDSPEFGIRTLRGVQSGLL
jgi:hypothetical protein